MPKPKREPPESVQGLAHVMPIEWRFMFGGVGIYSEGIFFALVSSEGILHFRVEDSNRPEYVKAGSGAFSPYTRVKSRAGQRIIMPYWTVPEKVLEKPATLRRWAEKALDAARAARTARSVGNRKGATKSRPR
jgi:DNA transformation protein